jgi:hypothetical protein
MLIVGAVLRLRQWFACRALWLDEAMLVDNLARLSFWELSQGLDLNQAAPLGFLWLQKILMVLLGDSELVLRTAPLIFGIGSLVLAAKYLQRFSVGVGLFLGLLFVCFSDSLVYFSNEVKHYEIDVFVALLLLNLAASYFDPQKTPSHSRVVNLSLWGALGLWFSYPALFVLGAIGLAMLWRQIREKCPGDWFKLGIIFCVWGISLLGLFFISIQPQMTTDLSNFWSRVFMPWPPWKDWKKFGQLLILLFHNPANVFYLFLGIPVFFLGAWAMVRKNALLTCSSLLPLLLALFASSFGLYPFFGRLLLFSLPAMLLALAMGIELLVKFGIRYQKHLAVGLGMLLAGYLYSHNLKSVAKNFWEPLQTQDLRPALSTLQKQVQKGDTLYVFPFAVPGFRYYSRRMGLSGVDIFEGHFLLNRDYSSEIKQFDERRRVWVLYSSLMHNPRTNPTDQQDHKDLVLDQFRQRGQGRIEQVLPGVSLYLFDLSKDRLH